MYSFSTTTFCVGAEGGTSTSLIQDSQDKQKIFFDLSEILCRRTGVGRAYLTDLAMGPSLDLSTSVAPSELKEVLKDFGAKSLRTLNWIPQDIFYSELPLPYLQAFGLAERVQQACTGQLGRNGLLLMPDSVIEASLHKYRSASLSRGFERLLSDLMLAISPVETLSD